MYPQANPAAGKGAVAEREKRLSRGQLRWLSLHIRAQGSQIGAAWAERLGAGLPVLEVPHVRTS